MTVPPLCVVPTFLRSDADADVVLRCLVSLWSTRTGADVLVVDDGSPARALVDALVAAAGEVGAELVRKERHEGFAATANVGLRRALAEGRDAVLVNADLEFADAGWLGALLARTDATGRRAAVVGARLLYPNGDIQHAGRQFSALTRTWSHRFRHAPGDLAEAAVPCRCPVSGALMLVRHAALDRIGLLDEELPLGGEDLDYCLRAFEAGLESIYAPGAVAVHREGAFRARPTQRLARWARESEARLAAKWADVDLSPFTPAIL